jgi:hypothetical protein
MPLAGLWWGMNLRFGFFELQHLLLLGIFSLGSHPTSSNYITFFLPVISETSFVCHPSCAVQVLWMSLKSI